VIHDFRSQKGRYSPSASVINAILVNSTTTMVGFGSMMIAAHRGLYSLGLVLTIGVGTCLLVSIILVPALLTLISSRRAVVDAEAGDVAAEAGAIPVVGSRLPAIPVVEVPDLADPHIDGSPEPDEAFPEDPHVLKWLDQNQSAASDRATDDEWPDAAAA